MSFESDLDELFEKAIDVYDTMWFDESETLRDAIIRIYADERTKTCKECYNQVGRAALDELEAKGDK